MKVNEVDLKLAVKAAEKMLGSSGAKAALIIATDEVDISGSVPEDSFATTVLITSVLSEVSDEIKEAVKKYLEEEC